MTLYLGLLLAALLTILAGAELFTNSLEHLGARFGLSEGLVGSIFAAVATALPETVVPVIAVFSGSASPSVREAVGVGAILGSPLMLVALGLALIGVFAGTKRGWNTVLKPETSGLLRDLGYFLVAYLIAFMGLYIPPQSAEVRVVAGLALVFLYAYYVYNTVLASALLVKKGHGVQAERPLYMRRLGIPQSLSSKLLQLTMGLALIIGGAKLFVLGIEATAGLTGASPLLLSLLLIPIATEMPEKFNGVLWVRRGKDTLAFGNLTGAMVFQGTLLPAFGLQLAAWRPTHEILLTMAFTFAGTLWTLLLALRRRITPLGLMLNALAYASFFLLLLRR